MKQLLFIITLLFSFNAMAEDTRIKLNEKIGNHAGKVMVNVAMLSGVVVNCKNDNSTKIF